jgi:hypothetical protein
MGMGIILILAQLGMATQSAENVNVATACPDVVLHGYNERFKQDAWGLCPPD